jgi:hypothetical protein
MALINCFINGASHAYHATHNAPMVDEDLSMSFDAADTYACKVDTASASDEILMRDAHSAGAAYINK